MAPTVERVLAINCLKNGEAPHWDEANQNLYFVDVYSQNINRYVASTGQHTKAQLENRPTFIIPVKGEKNQFVSAIGKDIVIITWDGQSEKVSEIKKIAEAEPGTKNKLNDGKCDSKGRLWSGTMDLDSMNIKTGDLLKEGTGTLVMLDNKDISTQETKIACSNGLAWNKQNNKFYYNDSLKKTVDAFDFDLEKGLLTNRKEIFTLSKHNIPGFPDGMTIDDDGNLWVALYSGSRILKIDPRKPETLLQTVELPALQVTSLAWGGTNLDELYVTSSSKAIDGGDLPPPNHGAVYKITNLGTKGILANKFVLKEP